MPVRGWIIHGIKRHRPATGEFCVVNEFECKGLFSEEKTKFFGRALLHAQSCVFQGSHKTEEQNLQKALKLMVTQPPLKKLPLGKDFRQEVAVQGTVQ